MRNAWFASAPASSAASDTPVFGEHRFCPVCGLLPPLVIAIDGLAAETVRLDALDELPHDVRRRLQESGVVDRTYADAIENVVGIVEAIAERVFRATVPTAEQVLKGKGKVFQRADDLADLFHAEGGIDLRGELGGTWTEMTTIWATRHVFTHCDGIVDAKYLQAVPRVGFRWVDGCG